MKSASVINGANRVRRSVSTVGCGDHIGRNRAIIGYIAVQRSAVMFAVMVYISGRRDFGCGIVSPSSYRVRCCASPQVHRAVVALRRLLGWGCSDGRPGLVYSRGST